jgi:hypothetical protein
MTEADWLSATEPQAMLAFLRDSCRVSERKLRLFACAYARQLWPQLDDERSTRAVEVAEQYADGVAHERDRQKAWQAADDVVVDAVAKPDFARAAVVVYAKRCLAKSKDQVLRLDFHFQGWTPVEVRLVKDIFGNPFQGPPAVPAPVLAWNDGAVVRLAAAAYEERLLPQGTLDPARLAVLADALEEAGCADTGLLGHLRGPGPHVRGCHGVDRILQRG